MRKQPLAITRYRSLYELKREQARDAVAAQGGQKWKKDEGESDTVCRRLLYHRKLEGTPARTVSFAAGVEKDKEAVKAGLTWWINSGMVDGHVTKLKLIKRQGYGQTGFPRLAKTGPPRDLKILITFSEETCRKDNDVARNEPIAFGLMPLSNRVL